jgi:hypothetical protein
MDKAAEEAEGLQDQVTIHTINFHHPYTPYDIQETFMSTVYQGLEDGKVGILESPTGTVSKNLLHVILPLNLSHVQVAFIFPCPYTFSLLFKLNTHCRTGQIAKSNLWISDLATRSQTEDFRGRSRLGSKW